MESEQKALTAQIKWPWTMIHRLHQLPLRLSDCHPPPMVESLELPPVWRVWRPSRDLPCYLTRALLCPSAASSVCLCCAERAAALTVVWASTKGSLCGQTFHLVLQQLELKLQLLLSRRPLSMRG